jgi:hypothetical protein
MNKLTLYYFFQEEVKNVPVIKKKIKEKFSELLMNWP